MQAIILAGGFGTRLQSVVADVPKPMAPIGDRPFLAYLIEYLKSQGVRRVVLSVHHLRDAIQAYFQSSYQGVAIAYAVEEQPLGTGGAIVNSLKHIEDAAQPVLVLNGDTFLKLDYQKMWQQHQDHAPLITMALRNIPDCSRYGVVQLAGNRVTAFLDKGHHQAGFINGGVYVLSARLFDVISMPDTFSFESDFLYPHAELILPDAFFTDDYFIDIGIPEDYKRAQDELPKLMAAHPVIF